MGDSQETDNYEERLREVFSSFDASGTGSLSPEELADLCQSLHLDDAVPALLHALVQNEDRITGRVEFDQFKNALILVLSSSIEAPQTEEETSPQPESAEIQPKFVKGSKRYGRHSTPEYIETVADFSEVINTNPADGLDPEEENEDAAVPRKRERWNAHEAGTEEYEAEGQLHLWNPDEPSTPRGSVALPSVCSEERLREACRDLGLPWDGCAERRQLVALCDQLGLEHRGDLLQSVSGGGVVNIQEFVSMLASQTKPPTPSASTPYRQLKRHHSTQPFDEAGRRIATPSVMTSTIGMRLFSALDDGTGCTPVEYILDAWMEEGIENSTEILQALDFSLNGKLNLSELTMALENELLVTKNGIHQAALASFKAEIRHLFERVEQELGEKERIRCDLEKAEKLKSQLATEVDEHHSAIEHMNNLNLRRLEQEHKEKLAAVRSELIQEVEQIQQQAGLHREELEAEIKKIRDDESFLRDHLSISVKENRRLELELFDSTEKLVEAQSQVAELQTSLDNILREKFGDLDPGSADFFNQEERIKQLHSSYEAQCRELQDRVDELQSELQEFHSLGRVPQHVGKPLSEELESKSPGMESDPGLGSEEGQPFNMSLEAEMMLEHLKEQHLQQIEILRTQLENKITEFDQMTEQQRVSHEEQKAAISLQYQEEIQGLTETMTSIQNHAQELQHQLEEVELEHTNLELRQAGEREELKCQQEKEVETIRQQLLETHTHATDLEEQLKTLKAQHAEAELCLYTETGELKKHHALELKTLEQRHKDLLEEERIKLQEERAESEQRLLEKSETEKEQLKQDFEDDLRARLEEANRRFEEEREELTRKLAEEWQKEKAQLDEQSNDSLQTMLEEEMLRLVREQEERESKLREEWEIERAQLQGCQEEAVLTRLVEERLKLQEEQEQRESRLKEEWERDKLQLEEDYEGMLQDRLNEERDKLDAEKEDVERRFKQLMEEEKTHLEESHREAMQELTVKHSEERERLGSVLDKLRDDIAEERLKLGHYRKEKIAAQKMAENFKKQISELRHRSQQLEEENVLLTEKNAQNAAEVEELSQQVVELIKENERRKAVPDEDETQMAACVSALEAELTRALEGNIHLEERNAQLTHQLSGLRDKVAKVDSMESQFSHLLQERKTVDKVMQSLGNQLAKAQEKIQALDDCLKAVNLQSTRLKSDLHVSLEEGDALKHEVMSLHKKLQNANDKNHVLEVALHSSGLQSQHKKLCRDEVSRVLEQEQQLLRQENERLQVEVHNTKGDLVHSREKVRQLESTILSLKQQKQQSQSYLVKALEQENASLKQELKDKNKLTKGCEAGERHAELESLQQENEALKAQMARLSTQLLEAFQAQLVGLLPPSPHRIPRGQRGDDPDNMQDERERKMKNMEGRMREIEQSLHNVKMLLKEKVAQLKDQLHKNGKADVLIKDLYVENAQLLKALEVTEHRQKNAEKKNYLLEEKISSLNKIVRDLNPLPLPPVPHHFQSS
ncbi:ninein isoform X2 [Lampris incognitus]|uniref:ninein isoform X2 n=1 Tax=Lampris incognitus TaxID=2546036 RepID=UPI0024B50C1D|nr:ninein isoform X2 [Lampris incognitus]